MIPIRHVWYQSQHEVVVDLLIKRVRTKDLVSDIQPFAVRLGHGLYSFLLILFFRFPQLAVDIRLPEGSTSFRLENLKHEILPTKSTVSILPTRIEIRLQKKEPGIKWTSIEAKDELAAEKAKAAQEAYIEELNGSFPRGF